MSHIALGGYAGHVDLADKDGRGAIHLAAVRYDYSECTQGKNHLFLLLLLLLLLSVCLPQLTLSTMYNHSDCTQALIIKGADVNLAMKKSGETPLHLAAQSHDELNVHLLLKAGADVHTRDADGRTPMNHARTPQVRDWSSLPPLSLSLSLSLSLCLPSTDVLCSDASGEGPSVR